MPMNPVSDEGSSSTVVRIFGVPISPSKTINIFGILISIPDADEGSSSTAVKIFGNSNSNPRADVGSSSTAIKIFGNSNPNSGADEGSSSTTDKISGNPICNPSSAEGSSSTAVQNRQNKRARDSSSTAVQNRRNKRARSSSSTGVQNRRNNRARGSSSIAVQNRRNNRARDDDTLPLLPPPSIDDFPALVEAINSRHASRAIFLYRKKINESDNNKCLSRLMLTHKGRKAITQFMTQEETTSVEQGFGLCGLDEAGRTYRLTLKIWPSMNQMVIGSGWNKIVLENQPRVGDVVEIWGFRESDGKLSFGVVFRTAPIA